MTAVALALAASLSWGAADFWGGLLARRRQVVAVALLSQGAGFLALLLVLAVAGAGVDRDGFLIGVVSGLGGGFGLAALYRALAVGTVSVVAPLAACGSIIPFALALIAGDEPKAIALVGAVAALAGAILASLEERRAEEPARRDAVVLAAAAAVLLGLFVYLLGRASQHGGALSALLGARTGSFGVLAAWALVARPGLALGGDTAAAAATGLIDVAANALFALASRVGLLAIVSVVGSLYPVLTVVLAHVVLHERISRLQRSGVAIALVGVALVAGAT